MRLYVLITESICRSPWLQVAEEALRGGADCLQLREKDLDPGEVLARARLVVELCRRHRAISIINDRPDIALLSGADGVHLGQQDLPPTEARRLLGPDKLIGVSTHNLEQARAARHERRGLHRHRPLLCQRHQASRFCGGSRCGAAK